VPKGALKVLDKTTFKNQDLTLLNQLFSELLVLAASFDKTKLESMLGEERTKSIKPGDMVVFTTV
jgi:hypothetical protein